MLKKLLLSLTFVSVSVCSFSATNAPAAGFVLMYTSENLPAPITTTGGSFVKLMLKKSIIDPVSPANMVLAINEFDPSVNLSAYLEASAMIRFAQTAAIPYSPNTNVNNLVDARNGGAYAYNPDGLKILFDKDYYFYFTYDLTTTPKTYSVYGRTEDMTEMFTIGKNLQYRKVPITGLNLRSTIYYSDTLVTPMPTMKIKEFKASEPLSYATAIEITSSAYVTNQKTELVATTVPETANAGIVWKVKSGSATITDGNIITCSDSNPVVIEAYAVTTKGATAIVATKTLIATTALKNIKADLGIKLNPTISKTGIFKVVMTNNADNNNTYKVFDICGKNISSGKVEGSQLNIGTSKAGLYFVKFSNTKGSKTVQVLVK